MRFLIDAQLPPALACFLTARGHEAAAVSELSLRDAEDETIWEAAKRGGYIVVTKDEDFAQVSAKWHFAGGHEGRIAGIEKPGRKAAGPLHRREWERKARSG